MCAWSAADKGLFWLYEAKWLRTANPQFCPQFSDRRRRLPGCPAPFGRSPGDDLLAQQRRIAGSQGGRQLPTLEGLTAGDPVLQLRGAGAYRVIGREGVQLAVMADWLSLYLPIALCLLVGSQYVTLAIWPVHY